MSASALLPRVVVLHHADSSVNLRELVLAAAGRVQLHMIFEPSTDAKRLAETFSRVIPTDVVRRTDWVDEVRNLDPDGVTTFADQYVSDLEAILRELRLPGASRHPGVWDKWQQRELLNASGASSLFVARVGSLEDLRAAREAGPASGVLKPRRSSTSRGIAFVSEDVPISAFRDHLAQGLPYIYEERLGTAASFPNKALEPFVSVETVSDPYGDRHHVGIFDKLPLVDGYLETGDIFPSSLPESMQRDVLRVVDLALSALGVRSRVTHTEVRFTDRGPQVIEVNGRLGGYMGEMLRISTNLDLCRVSLQLAVGAAPDRSAHDSHHQPRSVSGLILVPLHHAHEAAAVSLSSLLRSFPGVASSRPSAPVGPSFRTVAALLAEDSRSAIVGLMRTIVSEVTDRDAYEDLVDREWANTVIDLGL